MHLKSKNTPCLSHCAREGRHGSGLWRPPLEIMMKTTSNLGAWTTTCSSTKLWQSPGRQSSSTTGRWSTRPGPSLEASSPPGTSLSTSWGSLWVTELMSSLDWRALYPFRKGGFRHTRFDVICYMRQNIKKDFISTIYEIISAQNYYNYFNNFN